MTLQFEFFLKGVNSMVCEETPQAPEEPQETPAEAPAEAPPETPEAPPE
jgi:hypothetical protein